MDEWKYKCKCGSLLFEISLNCKIEDVVDDTVFSSIVCAKCGDVIYSFEEDLKQCYDNLFDDKISTEPNDASVLVRKSIDTPSKRGMHDDD